MEIELPETNYENIKHLIIYNIKSYPTPIDSYYEDHVIESKHYYICIKDKIYGYLSIFDGKLLTQYYIDDKFLALTNTIFEMILKKNMFSEIYVSTSDKKMLTMALDYYKSIDVQDYVFQVGKIEKVEPEFQLRKAIEPDQEIIKKSHESFFQRLELNIKNEEIYIGSYNDKIVSFGIIEKSKIYEKAASIGIFVIKPERGNNYGSMTIGKLVAHCARNGITPIAGCFSKNTYSRNAAFKAGMYSNTRLLRITV